jgi:hypothetical protein
MRRDNRSARILAIPKVVAMQRLNLDLEKKASLGGTRETSFWLWCSVLS